MASNILNIGKSALNAAQVGISTTGHNIANASTPGYSRQVVVQAASQAQNFGYGYVGQGAEIASVRRIYNEILAAQMVRSQATSSATDAYKAEMTTMDNMLSNPTAGLTPALNDFFGSVRDLSANPSDIATRQTMLSNAQTLANRFQSTNTRLNEVRDGVNSQITTSITTVNAYAKQIANLNDVIEKALSADGNPPNDLMDQRDQLVNELSKEIKTTVVAQGQGGYNIYVGNGLPLVVGKETYQLIPANSPTDPSRTEVAYLNNGNTTILGANSLPGGKIGGLLQFRSESLDPIQNQIGQIAATVAETFNDQHMKGMDRNGAIGGALFTIPDPAVSSNANNIGNAVIESKIVDVSALKNSDYTLEYNGTDYKITRLSDNTVFNNQTLPKTLDGLSFTLASGAPSGPIAPSNVGDNFVVRPTLNTAGNFKVAITDPNKLAVGLPVNASAASTNTGSGKITTPSIESSYASAPLSSPFTLTYNAGAPNTLTGFIATEPVSVTVGGMTTNYAAGAPVTFVNGATITTAGLSFTLSGTPNNGDQFTIAPNATNAQSDNRNGLLLAGLQTSKTMNEGKSTFTDIFSATVNRVGNKTRELNVMSKAETQVLEQSTAAVQAESGVNLDEEATNLIRYQQAYQAAGKMMQIASQLFDVLLQLG